LVAACVLGVRLIKLSLRTGGVPERALGAAYFVGGFVGFALVLVATPVMEASPSVFIHTLFSLGFTLISFGVVCTYIFVWKTFRPRSALAGWATMGAAAMIAVSLFPLWTSEGPEIFSSPLQIMGDCFRIAGLVWGSFEALNYHTAMRRRLAVGLADPVVVNRFLLWALACLSGVMVTGASMMLTMTGENDPQAWPYLLIGIFAFTAPVCQWLAFFPSDGYRSWIAGRHAAQRVDA
jgi:hypothetical protein